MENDNPKPNKVSGVDNSEVTEKDSGAIQEQSNNQDVVDEDAVDEDAVDEDAVDEDAVDEDAVDEDAVDEDAVDEDAVDEDAVDEEPPELDPLLKAFPDVHFEYQTPKFSSMAYDYFPSISDETVQKWMKDIVPIELIDKDFKNDRNAITARHIYQETKQHTEFLDALIKAKQYHLLPVKYKDLQDEREKIALFLGTIKYELQSYFLNVIWHRFGAELKNRMKIIRLDYEHILGEGLKDYFNQFKDFYNNYVVKNTNDLNKAIKSFGVGYQKIREYKWKQESEFRKVNRKMRGLNRKIELLLERENLYEGKETTNLKENYKSKIEAIEKENKILKGREHRKKYVVSTEISKNAYDSIEGAGLYTKNKKNFLNVTIILPAKGTTRVALEFNAFANKRLQPRFQLNPKLSLKGIRVVDSFPVEKSSFVDPKDQEKYEVPIITIVVLKNDSEFPYTLEPGDDMFINLYYDIKLNVVFEDKKNPLEDEQINQLTVEEGVNELDQLLEDLTKPKGRDKAKDRDIKEKWRRLKYSLKVRGEL